MLTTSVTQVGHLTALFSDKNDDFPSPTFYMQLPDFIATHRWKELFNLKKMTYNLSIYFHIW